jgi:hypothetical protein
MTPTCLTCRHWSRISYAGLRQHGDEKGTVMGECRGLPPPQDFRWPRTRSIDRCGHWAATQPAPSAPQPAPARPAQGEIFSAGQPAGGPAAVLAYNAAPGSTPSPTDPALIDFATGTTPAGARKKTRKENP